MKNLKAPIQEHRCEALKNCVSVSIAKRDFNGKSRWMWEQSQKNGHISANEITFCPYCGINLDGAAQENRGEKA